METITPPTTLPERAKQVEAAADRATSRTRDEPADRVAGARDAV